MYVKSAMIIIFLLTLFFFSSTAFATKKTITPNDSTNVEKAAEFIELAEKYASNNRAAKAFRNYRTAMVLYEQAGKEAEAMDCNLEIFYLLDGQNNLKIDPLPYLDNYYAYAKKNNDVNKQMEANLAYASYYFTSQGYKNSITYYNKAFAQAQSMHDSLVMGKINTNIGLLYSGFVAEDSAQVYFNRALGLFKPEHTTELFSTYLNYANSYQKQKKYTAAIALLKQAECIKPKKYRQGLFKNLYKKIADCYSNIGNHQEAYVYLNKYSAIKDSINATQQNIAISEIQTKYETEKKEKENLLLKTNIERKTRTQTILWTSLFLVVTLGAVFSLLIYKNAKKKQKILAQHRELAIKKIEKELKEQELNTIDLMISGQEKERQRLAENLHDNLGSTLAAIKLNLRSFQEKTEGLGQKTQELIDEAYEKVRTIAHEKNSGVMAKEGLLPAVKRLARTISASKKIEIKIEEFGLNQRLDNSLEITIFRIIQELVTNIIKHAEATEATISLTNHKTMLNIIVEDNGKGFRFQKQSHKNGMGLSNIEKRVEHLGGSIEVDSFPNKGTSVIINLPI